MSVGNGATLVIDGNTFSMPASGNGLTISVPSLTFTVPIELDSTGTFTGGTTFNTPQNSLVSIVAGTFTGGVTFNAGDDATIDLTGGHTVTYGGTLTGSGPGTVQFESGGIDVALGGVTLNFGGTIFQWVGGNFFAASGNVVNLGTLNLSGSNDKGFSRIRPSTILARSSRPALETLTCIAIAFRRPSSKSNRAASTRLGPIPALIISTAAKR